MRNYCWIQWHYNVLHSSLKHLALLFELSTDCSCNVWCWRLLTFLLETGFLLWIPKHLLDLSPILPNMMIAPPSIYINSLSQCGPVLSLGFVSSPWIPKFLVRMVPFIYCLSLPTATPKFCTSFFFPRLYALNCNFSLLAWFK